MAINEGQTVQYTLRTTNTPDGTTLYWKTTGNTTNSDIVGGNTGSITIVNNQAVWNVTVLSDLNTDGTKELGMSVLTGSLNGPAAVRSQSSIIVNDTSLTGFLVEYLVVAGGAGGGIDSYSGIRGSGGGGAGGYLAGNTTSVLSGTPYTITIGAGGSAGSGNGAAGDNGSNSTFSTITSIGGGGGAGMTSAGSTGGQAKSGGSGGGGTHSGSTGGAGTLGQGNAGGTSTDVAPYRGAGGGGASQAGAGGGAGSGAGGNGSSSSISGASVTYAGGGGGSRGASGSNSPGGSGGGGESGVSGTANSGGGGGGSSIPGSGGSGITILRYLGTPVATGGTITQSGGYTYHTFTSSGTFTLA